MTTLASLTDRCGITVAELKKHIAEWPLLDADGAPTEVWIETGNNMSSPCIKIEVLNLRTLDDGTLTSDLLFVPKTDKGDPLATPKGSLL